MAKTPGPSSDLSDDPQVPLFPSTERNEVQAALLTWGDKHRRDLPWRYSRDPWEIHVAEVMLQQTQVDRVMPRWTDFLERFPSVADCAAAPASAVIELWDGLGYNRRALLLHRAAAAVTASHNGVYPDTLRELQGLPGIGAYTARAILAFAFERDVAVVDTNVGRILARLAGQPFAPKAAQAAADSLVPDGGGWAWNQTILDLGATVCTKKRWSCEQCPLQRYCLWQGTGQDPAIGSAAVSGGQSKFEGSDRQGRGRLVSALRTGPIALAELAAVMGWPDNPQRAERVLKTLIADGMVEATGGTLQLPR